MDDHIVAGALRGGEPGAVYDAYADRLYAYCWFQLTDRDAAQTAVRDTMIRAQADVGDLRDTRRLRTWLYSQARRECRWRVPADRPDVPLASHEQPDVDLRVMAWQATAALPGLGRELLDLRYRHDLSGDEIAIIAGVPVKEVEAVLSQARGLLAAALTAEILAADGPYECAGRAVVLRDRRPVIDDDLREGLVRHASECEVCGRHLPRNVSPVKVFSLLPDPRPPAEMRERVLSAVPPLRPPPPRGRRVWPRAVAAVAGSLAMVAVAVGTSHWISERHDADTAGRPSAQVPRPLPGVPGHRPGGSRPVSAVFPLGAREPVAPAIELKHGRDYQAAPGSGHLIVGPGSLSLGPGRAGTITVRAVGGELDWQASVTGPVRLSVAGGPLNSGDTTTITVTASGAGAIVFQPGGIRVTVGWASAPSPPPTHSSPKPPPTTSAPPPPTTPPPSPSPSPSPTGSAG